MIHAVSTQMGDGLSRRLENFNLVRKPAQQGGAAGSQQMGSGDITSRQPGGHNASPGQQMG